VTALLLVVDKLEVVRLWLASENRLQHLAEFFVPGTATKLIDFVANALLRREAKHFIETFIRGADGKLSVENQQRFAGGRRTIH
jgi:hypothetical protein